MVFFNSVFGIQNFIGRIIGVYWFWCRSLPNKSYFTTWDLNNKFLVSEKIQTVAIIGFISKGLIYVVIGVLSLLAALNLGGESSGTNSALLFLKEQMFGQFLLTALAVGLLCYSFWMFLRSIKDPEHLGSDRKSKLMRVGFFTTGLVYTVLAVLAFIHLFGAGAGDSASRYLDYFGHSFVSIAFIAIGIVLVGQGLLLTVGVLRGGLLEQFNIGRSTGARLLKWGGKFGFYSRAFVVFIIAYFFLREGIYSRGRELKGIADAFSFLDQSGLGRILMAVTAVGFISYGLFYILLARFRNFGE